jgi:hypothetical protein
MSFNEKTLKMLTDQLSGNYDIESDVSIINQKVSLLARSKLNFQHYAVSKKIILDEIHVNDYIIVQEKKLISEQELEDAAGWLKQFAQSEIEQHSQHMQSRFVGFFIVEQNIMNKKTENYFKKFHRFHWIKFGFKGWYEIFFILYFTNSLTWILPQKGKDFIPLLENLTAKLKTA